LTGRRFLEAEELHGLYQKAFRYPRSIQRCTMAIPIGVNTDEPARKKVLVAPKAALPDTAWHFDAAVAAPLRLAPPPPVRVLSPGTATGIRVAA
jgi:hypothetical protein